MSHTCDVCHLFCFAWFVTGGASRKSYWLVDSVVEKRRYCSELCMLRSFREERRRRLKASAYAVARQLLLAGFDKRVAELIWRMSAPRYEVKVMRLQSVSASLHTVSYSTTMELF